MENPKQRFKVGDKAEVFLEYDFLEDEILSWVGCIVTILRVNEDGVPYDYFVERKSKTRGIENAYYDDHMLARIDQSTPVCERCSFEIENGVCVECGWDNGALASQTEVREDSLKRDFDALKVAYETLLNDYRQLKADYQEMSAVLLSVAHVTKVIDHIREVDAQVNREKDDR